MNQPLKSVLLIEDCEADNYLHKKVINSVGVAKEIVVMRSGADALAHLNANREKGLPQPELIFLDINTPGMEGWDFLQEFDKFDESTKEGSVIVMLSGSLNPDDKTRAESLPAIAEYRTKPLTREALREIMAKQFEESGTGL